MQTKKMIALVVALVLAFCSFTVAYAEAVENVTTTEPTAFYAVSTDTEAQTPEQTIAPIEKTSAVTTEQPAVTLEATAERSSVETPAEQSGTPVATQQPTETVTDSATPVVEEETPVADATVTPVPQTQPARSASIQVEVPSNPQYGDTVTLKATLNGYDGSAVQLQWQYSRDQENWVNARGNSANSAQYSFKISDETVCTYWRLAVTAD